MNRSGEGVRYLFDRFGACPDDLVAIYDDMDLPLGKVRIRTGGSAGGHNGLKSIIATLTTQRFPRVRVGIGKPQGDKDEVSFVLEPFSPEERRVMAETLDTVVRALTCILRHDIQVAMNEFN